MTRPLVLVVLLAGCGAEAPPPVSEISAPPPTPVSSPAPEPYKPPAEADIPEGPLGDSIRRGLDLFTHTSERLPQYAPGNIRCSNCHLDAGTRPGAAPVAGAIARFPKYMERTGATIALQDRINYCFTRSEAGSRLPTDSQEMVDLVAYIAWLSKGVPVGGHIEGEALPKMPALTGDAARGEALYQEKGCVGCHGNNGEGVVPTFPALWGEKSYSIGASMAREERAASFIKLFMPQNAPGTLTDQEAYDLAAFVNSHPRPDSPGKELDWPKGGAPADVPYDTNGHTAYRPPPLLPRNTPDRAVVPPPPALSEAR